jgi:tRNA dimethylallyltransferase
MVATIIDVLLKKGKIPIVAGGTGLYIKAMTRGIFSGPSADWSLREDLLSMEKEEKGSLYNYLKELDPVAAEKITPNDTRRIIRALEVCLKSKIPMSEIQEKLTNPLPYEFIKIGITRERKELYRLIENRVDEMFKAGLIEEVKMVIKLIEDAATQRHAEREKENFTDSPIHRFTDSPFPSMQAIGYKEIARYLYADITLDEAIGLIKKGTKRYAKRQFTWFKKEEGIHWVDITGIDDIYETFMCVNHILRYLL